MEKGISREAFRYAERLLYSHREAKKELERLREEILFEKTSYDENIGGGKSNLPRDPIGNAVSSLYSHKRVGELEESVRVVDEIYQQLPEEKKQIVKLYYWSKPRKLTLYGVAIELEKGEKTVRRWKNEIVQLVAIRKGLI